MVLALAAATGTFLFLRETEPDRVIARVVAVVRAVRVEPGEGRAARRTRIERAFRVGLAPDLRVQAPDLPAGDPVTTATRLGEGFEEAHVEIEQPNVEIDPSGRQARVHARALLSGRSPTAGLVTDTRELRIDLIRAGEVWQLAAIEATGPSHVEPEPRP
jgi:hypothetical protein